MKESDELLDQFQTIKVIAFMEVEPLTDKFELIAFTEEQVKEFRMKLFDIIAGAPVSDDLTAMVDVITDDEVTIKLPDVRESYGPDFFKEK